jgi:hypothetical protein
MRPIVGALRGTQMMGRSNPMRSNARWVRVLLKVEIMGRLAADRSAQLRRAPMLVFGSDP